MVVMNLVWWRTETPHMENNKQSLSFLAFNETFSGTNEAQECAKMVPTAMLLTKMWQEMV